MKQWLVKKISGWWHDLPLKKRIALLILVTASLGFLIVSPGYFIGIMLLLACFAAVGAVLWSIGVMFNWWGDGY